MPREIKSDRIRRSMGEPAFRRGAHYEREAMACGSPEAERRPFFRGANPRSGAVTRDAGAGARAARRGEDIDKALDKRIGKRRPDRRR